MANETETKRIAPWVWIFNLGLALVFIYFLYFLKSVPETTDTSDEATISDQQPAKQQTSTEENSDFSFYELLPESEVKAPTVEEYKPKKLPENVSFVLQTGSFRNFADAERQRANIAFQGLKAEVRQISLADDNIWYRVQIGPYTSRSKMNSAIDRLVSINIQPLVKKQTLPKE